MISYRILSQPLTESLLVVSRERFFNPVKRQEMQLFLDGTLKIIAKIDSGDGGYYLMVASNTTKTK